MEDAIRTYRLTKHYGGRKVVDNLDLCVPRGSVYGLLGRNGAGKSSLVRCLLGQRQPDWGSIAAFGENVWTHRAALMQRIGVVSDTHNRLPNVQRIVALFNAAAVERVIHTGDVTQARTIHAFG